MTRRILAFALALAAALAAAPARADTTRDNIPQIFTMSPMGVNLQTGVFIHSETDFTIGSLAFVRSWRAVPSFMPNGGLSSMDHHAFAAWNHNYGFGATRHQTAPDGVNIHADGKVYQFRVNNEGTVWTPWNLDQHNDNSRGTLLTGAIDSNLVFRNQAGDVFTMNSNNQAIRVERADGTRLELGYDSTRRLRTVLSNRGDAIVLDYGANGRLATACGYDRAATFVGPATTCAAAPVKVSYAYSSTSAAQGWNLTQVTKPDLTAIAMTYDTYFKPNLVCIKVPSSAPCRVTNSYGPQPGDLEPALTRPDQVRVQTTATGETWTYFYINASIYADWPPLVFGEVRETESYMTDPSGRATLAQYENGFLKRLYAPEGLTQYDWAMLKPAVFTHPAGNKEQLGYDLRNNVLSRRRIAVPGSNLADIEATATYPASDPPFFTTGCAAASQKLCDKPISTADENGNTTDYSYDPAHGGVLTETRPAVMSNGVMARPQKRFTWEARYAGVKNSGGTIVSAEAPVWLLVEERECRTVGSPHGQPSPCAGSADEIRTVYEYGPSGSANALRLRGKVVDAGGLSLRTCTGYDALGNAISSSSPKSAAASNPCP